MALYRTTHSSSGTALLESIAPSQRPMLAEVLIENEWLHGKQCSDLQNINDSLSDRMKNHYATFRNIGKKLRRRSESAEKHTSVMED